MEKPTYKGPTTKLTMTDGSELVVRGTAEEIGRKLAAAGGRFAPIRQGEFVRIELPVAEDE